MPRILIDCISCGHQIGTHDGKSTLDKIIQCKNCGKYNLFHADTGITEATGEPERTCGSGKRFY